MNLSSLRKLNEFVTVNIRAIEMIGVLMRIFRFSLVSWLGPKSLSLCLGIQYYRCSIAAVVRKEGCRLHSSKRLLGGSRRYDKGNWLPSFMSWGNYLLDTNEFVRTSGLPLYRDRAMTSDCCL